MAARNYQQQRGSGYGQTPPGARNANRGVARRQSYEYPDEAKTNFLEESDYGIYEDDPQTGFLDNPEVRHQGRRYEPQEISINSQSYAAQMQQAQQRIQQQQAQPQPQAEPEYAGSQIFIEPEELIIDYMTQGYLDETGHDTYTYKIWFNGMRFKLLQGWAPVGGTSMAILETVTDPADNNPNLPEPMEVDTPLYNLIVILWNMLDFAGTNKVMVKWTQPN